MCCVTYKGKRLIFLYTSDNLVCIWPALTDSKACVTANTVAFFFCEMKIKVFKYKYCVDYVDEKNYIYNVIILRFWALPGQGPYSLTCISCCSLTGTQCPDCMKVRVSQTLTVDILSCPGQFTMISSTAGLYCKATGSNSSTQFTQWQANTTSPNIPLG